MSTAGQDLMIKAVHRAIHSGGSGGYTGARSDRRALSEWLVGGGSADSDTLDDLQALRNRSRDLIRNAPLAAGAINTNVTSTIGRGLRVQPRINRELLGLSEEEADQWERDAQQIFQLCADQLDITRTLTFTGLQEMACRSPLESGDLFVLRRQKRHPGDILGLKVQLIEADRVCNPMHRMDSNLLRGGVELDRDGAPSAYHVADRHPGDLFQFGLGKWKKIPAFGRRSGRRQVLHIYKTLRPGQTRGVPYLAPAIEPFKQLDRYSDAEIMAAVINAMFTVFIKSEGGDDAGAGMLEHLQEEGEDAPVAGESDYKLGSGTMLGLQPGETVESVATNRPNANYDPFVMAVLRQAGVALELPFEVLIKHFTSSYSASRAALLEAWRYFMVRRQFVASSFCQPVYEWAITEAVAAGYLSAPGLFNDSLRRRAWLGAYWIGDAPGQLDPKKEADGAVVRLGAGLSTLELEVPAISGVNWEDVHHQRAKELRMRRSAGMTEPGEETVAERSDEAPGRYPSDRETDEEEE